MSWTLSNITSEAGLSLTLAYQPAGGELTEVVLSPGETFTLEATKGSTLGNLYSTIKIYDNWGVEVKDLTDYETNDTETYELGQYRQTYYTDPDLGIVWHTPAVVVRGIYGTGVENTTGISNPQEFIGNPMVDGSSGNWGIGTYDLNFGESSKYYVAIGYSADYDDLPWEVIGEIDGKDLLERTGTDEYVYEIQKELTITVMGNEKTCIPNLYISSTDQLTLDQVTNLINSITYIEPRTFTYGTYVRDTSVQNIVWTASGAHIELPDPGSNMWYWGTGNQGTCLEAFPTRSTYLYVGAYFIEDEQGILS